MNYFEVILKYYPNVGFGIGDTYETGLQRPYLNQQKKS
jgi:hypothetical protein